LKSHWQLRAKICKWVTTEEPKERVSQKCMQLEDEMEARNVSR
jgi:hypothetical protein